ncbi:MAG: hypothetical protein MJ105_01740 [Lachnospiraceae bacterium]|nr:hypothetical protein [Lachnospiraceae bacterium]
MICYKDEKMHGFGDLTIEEIQTQIDAYEIERFGEKLPEDFGRNIERKPMIYDIELGKLVEIK